MHAGIFKRASITLALLWIVFTGPYAYFEADEEAIKYASSHQPACSSSTECKKFHDQLYYESWQDQGIWLVLIYTLAPIGFILASWFVFYIVIRTFFWIRTGSFRNQTSPTIKYSLLATLSFFILLGIWISYVAIHKENIKRSASNCKIEAIKSNIEILSDNGQRYLEACMISRGFELRDWSWCYNTKENAACYK